MLIPVLMIAAAWTAWRRDPAFSTRETWRRGIVLLLAVAGLVLVITVAVNLTIHRGPVIAGLTIGIVTLLATAGFIWGIMAFTAPPHPPLPAGTPLLWTYRRGLAGQARWLAITTGVVAALAATFSWLHWDLATLAVGMIGGMLVLIWGIVLFAQYIKAFQLDRALTANQLNLPRG